MKIQTLLANSSNFTLSRNENIKYIVIHYTANNGDTAKGNCIYFSKPNRNASAHYFVDQSNIFQSVLDKNTAWHCGTKGKYKHKFCRNENSIGIEICSNIDVNGDYFFNNDAVKNAISLTKSIMEKYNIPIENILRHFDVTGKSCPKPFVQNEKAWQNFKLRLKQSSNVDAANKGGQILQTQRTLIFENKKDTFDAVNLGGHNYFKISDIAKLLDLKLDYDPKTKFTKIYH